MVADVRKWRLTLESGEDFLTEFLERYSDRETAAEFTARKKLSPVIPAAKNAMLEFRNGIYDRVQEVSRVKGSPTYTAQVAGLNGGVDGESSTMNFFMGLSVLTELLAMGKVGVLVSRAGDLEIGDTPDVRTTLIKRESIIEDYSKDGVLQKVVYLRDEETHTLELVNGLVDHTIKIEASGATEASETTERTDLEAVPFVIVEILDSLFKDSADMQIAITNMNSADVSFLYRTNFPVYTEQRSATPLIVPIGMGEEVEPKKENIGALTGRSYSPGMERPGFIAPPTEPVDVSMKKQAEMELRIKDVMHLAMNEESTDGISSICLVLEKAERQIAIVWAEYEGNETPAEISYPETFTLKTEKDKREEATELRKIAAGSCSLLAQRELTKLQHTTLLKGKVSEEILEKIMKEIDSAVVVIADPDILREDVERGYLSGELAAKARKYPADDYQKAVDEVLVRINATAVAQQSGTRGVEETNNLDQPKADKVEKDGRGEQKGGTEDGL